MVAGAGDFPGCPGAKAGLHPGQVRSLSQGHIKRQTAIHNQFRTPSWPHMHVFCIEGGSRSTRREHLHRKAPGLAIKLATFLL